MDETTSRAPRSAPVRWPLVGRSSELALFDAVLRDPSGVGLLIHGPAGVGKTRLADECLAAAGRDRAVGRATASRTAGGAPLGALAHLLPACAAADPVSLYDRVAAALRQRAGHRRFVLLVDNLHWLDATSATLLGQLLDGGALFLQGTVRGGEPAPETVSRLWHGDRVARVDLADLPRDSVDTLLHLALGGPVEAGTVEQLWSASRGNVLFLRELVLGADSAGSLRQDNGVWRLIGPASGTVRLHELIADRLSGVPAAAGPLLEVLALGEPLGVTALGPQYGFDTLEAMERGGVVDVRVDGRRQQVRLAHPLYSESVRERMPVLTRRRLLLELATGLERLGGRRRGDLARIANWRLDATGSADPDVLLTAARLARYAHDFPQVERLTRATLAERMNPEAELLLGEALYETGAFDEAAAVLSTAEPHAVDEAQLVQIVDIRVRGLLWGQLRPEEALAVTRAAQQRVAPGPACNELVALEAAVLVFSGHPLASLATAERLPDTDGVRSRVLSAIARAPALVITGRCEDAVVVARQGRADHAELGDTLAIAHPGTHVVNEVFALTQAGRMLEAQELCAAAHRVASRDRSPIGLIWCTLHLGILAMFGGRPRTALRWFGEALAWSRQYHYDGPRRMALSGATQAAAALGDEVGAADYLAETDALPELGFLNVEQAIGRGWALAACGDLAAGRELMGAAATRARSSGQRNSELRLLVQIARLGDPAGVAARLAELSVQCQGQLAPAYAGFAAAAAAEDADGLVGAADRYEALGLVLHAAEAAIAAGHAAARQGDPRKAVALRIRAAALAERCEGASTPGLVTAAVVAALTRREREVALLAVRGLPSRDIAGRLVLSVRTVDNHLQNVYGKLGVAGRGDLAGALNMTSAVQRSPRTEQPPAGG